MIKLSSLVVLSTFCLIGIVYGAEDATKTYLQIEKTKEIWERLLQNYSKEFRPNYEDEAVTIRITAFVLSMPEIDSQKEQLTVNMIFRQIWSDPRLQHSKGDILKLDGSNPQWTRLWQPDTFVVNEIHAERHDITQRNMLMIIYPNGTVRHSSRYTIVTSCPMDFSNFPFDEQECQVQFESYGYGALDIMYEFTDFRVNQAISHAAFTIIGHKAQAAAVTLTGGQYSRAQFQILFHRNHGRYLTEFYYPCVFLASLSILSLFISEPRISLILNFLTMSVTILFLAVGSGNLEFPRVSYTTALDQFSSMTDTFVFLSLLASVLTLRLSTSNTRPQNFELSNLRPSLSSTHTRLVDGDEEVNLHDHDHSNSSDVTTRHTPQSKFQALNKILVDIFAVILPYLKIILVISYLFGNLVYWTTVPYKKPKYDDALLNQDWQIL